MPDWEVESESPASGESPVSGEWQISNEAPSQLSWGDVPGQAVQNLPGSAAEFGKSLVQPIIHPIETATAVKNIGQGVLEKVGIMSPADHEKYADAVGRFFLDRYGSMEGVKNTLATDPVGALADLSSVLTLGGGAAIRGAGLTGRAAEIAAMPGRLIDPTLAAAKAVHATGRGAAQVIGGLATHTGPEAIEIAGQAGREAGLPGRQTAPERAFKENIRGTAPMSEAVEEAQGAERLLRQRRSDAYEREMAQVLADKPLGQPMLSLDAVDKALNETKNIGEYKGRVIDADAVAAHQKISGIVDQFRKDPIHSIQDVDKLKQAVGSILKDQEANSREKLIAGKIYNAAKETIIKADPQYGKVMSAYEQATDQLDEINRTLSINPNATIDTALRKLQSTLRDNVNTSYGRRRELADFLVQNGAPNLLYKLAGQTLKPWAPRGMGRFALSLGAEIAAIATAGHVLGPHGLALAAALPLMSPRAVGVGAYHAGMASRYMPNLGAYQLGRLPAIESPQQFKRGGRVSRRFRVYK